MAFEKTGISMGRGGYPPIVLPPNPLFELCNIGYVSYSKIVFYYAPFDFPSSRRPYRRNTVKLSLWFSGNRRRTNQSGISSRLRTKRFSPVFRVFSFQFPTHPVYACLVVRVGRKNSSRANGQPQALSATWFGVHGIRPRGRVAG